MRESEIDRDRQADRARVTVNETTLGNGIRKCICHIGDSGVRVRFLRRWTKNT